ncbi:MAG TPA: cation:proton antiporter, partial [Afipia sp.]|nr:cation:proton antiporter [Afipia sp.]
TFAASAAAMVVSFLLLGAVMDSGTIDYAFGGWAAPFGIVYRVDLVNAYVLMIVSTISTVVSVF